MRQTFILIISAAMIVGCHSPKPVENVSVSVADSLPAIADQPATTQPVSIIVANGPTEMAKVAEGYELKNRKVRIVISEKTGDVIFWGRVNDNRSAVFRRGIFTASANMPEPTLDGYIEKRDDQTWQFFGTDSNKITWRKIYCLEHESFLVSILATNGQEKPLSMIIELRGDFPNLRITEHNAEQFTGSGAVGPIRIHAFNEFRSPALVPKLPILVQSDAHTLQPGEADQFHQRMETRRVFVILVPNGQA